MSISLKSLRSSAPSLPPRVIIHAVEGVGKTSLAAEFPDPVYLSTPGEATPAGIDLPSPGTVENWAETVGFIAELAQEEHDFKTLIVDAVDGLEAMIWRETAHRNNWKSIEDPGFGKGYLAADQVWREFLDGCDFLRKERRMTTILIAHSARVTHEEPGHQPYMRYDLRLQKRGQALLCDWADFILFVNAKVEVKQVEQGFNKKHVHAEGGGARWIFADARPAFVAKNRAANMPGQIMFPRGKGFEALAPHMYPSGGTGSQAEAA